MRILLIHQNFPGQFRHVAAEWARRPGWQVIGIGRDTAPGLPGVPGLRLIRYKPHRGVHREQHHYLRRMEDAVLHGQAVARVLLQLKKEGFTPDVILAHPGWGETLYAKDVFPHTRLVHYCEWFYNTPPLDGLDQLDRATWPYADVGYDPEFPVTFDDLARIRSWNALHLLNLQNCDAGISPTHWQKAQHPAAYLDKITVAHEGIDTENLGPDPNAVIKTPSGEILRANDPDKPVITYVARNLEPYRGFHTFMRALPAVQREHKNAHVVIVGGDEVSYGARPKDAKNWREKMLAEVGSQLDPTRTHFVGKVPYADYKRVLQVSAAHVYLTYPFVLSWSCLEAMATGCFVVGSDTAPVREVLVEGQRSVKVETLQSKAVGGGVLLALSLGEGGSSCEFFNAASIDNKNGVFQRAAYIAGMTNAVFGVVGI
ncbi:glycosyltransferase [Mitsuaria sp. WAJ17]|uniref:glycosyltransferase family 4 protein n=1 Tax=Mitsuaria sp. WAJ17 TaxID=2761452 RepID=UPI001601942F|nr:glycosyltransferase family 4 protein [Mitsuaria sp. WAJ17]MBB2485156.1 glycosyltransferase [Mitsuaria sp. WAJ17]